MKGKVRGKFDLEPSFPATGHLPWIYRSGDTGKNGIYMLPELYHVIKVTWNVEILREIVP